MSERSIRKGDRFRWWNSGKSGFQFGFLPLTSLPNAYSREAGRPVYDKGVLVSPDEFDQPPPSTKPLGGEGEIGTGARDNAQSVATPTSDLLPVQYLITTSKINWNFNNVPVYVTGSNAAVTLGNNPIPLGPNCTYISIQGVGNNVVINSGNGITFDSVRKPNITLGSGSIATFICNLTDNTWHLTSFSSEVFFG